MIEVDLKKGIYVQTHPKGKATAVYDKVVLMFGRNQLELTTPAAHRLGFALVRKELECDKGDYVVLTVNNVKIHLLPKDAKRIGGALIYQSDKADTFQRNISC